MVSMDRRSALGVGQVCSEVGLGLRGGVLPAELTSVCDTRHRAATRRTSCASSGFQVAGNPSGQKTKNASREHRPRRPDRFERRRSACLPDASGSEKLTRPTSGERSERSALCRQQVRGSRLCSMSPCASSDIEGARSGRQEGADWICTDRMLASTRLYIGEFAALRSIASKRYCGDAHVWIQP